VALGALMVADVLYINVRERSAELAALWAGGWPNGAMLRLVGYEGLGMGVLGGTLGAVTGLLGAIWFSGRLGLDMILLAVTVATGATMIAGTAAILPALALRRLPLSTVLAEE
jgi:putative ABC transport system permease protein